MKVIDGEDLQKMVMIDSEDLKKRMVIDGEDLQHSITEWSTNYRM